MMKNLKNYVKYVMKSERKWNNVQHEITQKLINKCKKIGLGSCDKCHCSELECLQALIDATKGDEEFTWKNADIT